MKKAHILSDYIFSVCFLWALRNQWCIIFLSFRFHSECQVWLNLVTVSQSKHENDDHMWVHSNSKGALHSVLISKFITFHVIIQLWRNNWPGLVREALRNCTFRKLSGASVIRSKLIPLVSSNQWLQVDHLIAYSKYVCMSVCMRAPMEIRGQLMRF